jgi:hypothetical protein
MTTDLDSCQACNLIPQAVQQQVQTRGQLRLQPIPQDGDDEPGGKDGALLHLLVLVLRRQPLPHRAVDGADVRLEGEALALERDKRESGLQ